MEATRINNDTNGNPRYVIHFTDLENNTDGTTEQRYSRVLEKFRKIGGKKYSTKNYGGGVVFQSWNKDNLLKKLKEYKLLTV